MNSSLPPPGPRVRNSLMTTGGVGVGETLGVGDGDGDGLGEGLGFGLGEGEGLGNGLGVGDGDTLGDGLGEGPGVALLLSFCGSLGVISAKSSKLLFVSCVLPLAPPGLRS